MRPKLSPKLPIITSKQKEILLYLYKFRFLTTNQFQKLFNHKDPHRIKEWLSDLMNKGYIKRHFNRKSFVENTKPAIYFLAPKARQVLKTEKDLDFDQLEFIYKESKRTKKFISHSLSLAEVLLYLLFKKEENEELKFFTKNELDRYEYFPQPLPDAFIAVKGQDTTRRYFLDLFDQYTPAFVLRQRVRMYLEYVENSDWDENTNYTPLPTILFVCPNESAKKHINFYAKALLEKTYEDKISLHLTTKAQIQFNRNKKENIWDKVKTD